MSATDNGRSRIAEHGGLPLMSSTTMPGISGDLDRIEPTAGEDPGRRLQAVRIQGRPGGAGVHAGVGECLPPVVSRSRGQSARPARSGDRVSAGHREEGMDGCPVVALGSDAARQGADVKASFEAGIREYLELLGSWVGDADGEEPRSRRQGHGHSLDNGRCGGSLAGRQRRADVEAVPASGRQERADGVVCGRCPAGPRQ